MSVNPAKSCLESSGCRPRPLNINPGSLKWVQMRNELWFGANGINQAKRRHTGSKPRLTQMGAVGFTQTSIPLRITHPTDTPQVPINSHTKSGGTNSMFICLIFIGTPQFHLGSHTPRTRDPIKRDEIKQKKNKFASPDFLMVYRTEP